MVSVKFDIPKNLDALDFDRKEVMSGIRKSTRLIQQTSKRLISTRQSSKPGEIPGRRTGRMRRNVKCHYSKRKDRLWGRVQVDTIADASVFYPAVLMHGKKDRTLLPRKNFVEMASNQTESQVRQLIDVAMDRGLKLWK